MYAKQKCKCNWAKQNETSSNAVLYDASIAYFNWKKTTAKRYTKNTIRMHKLDLKEFNPWLHKEINQLLTVEAGIIVKTEL
jgi:site-specific recombinase XerD